MARFLPSRTALGLAALFLLFSCAGWRGVDFGRHWDEGVIISAWKTTVSEGRYAPPYFYPGLFYDLSLPALGLAALEAPDREALLRVVSEMPFRLTVRRHFVFIVSFVVPLTFFGARRIRGRDLDGWVAAAVIATCWQLNYHSRFVVTDALVATFGPVSVWLALEAMRRPERAARLLAGASALAALATASKYPGAVVLAPVGWVALRGDPPERSLSSRIVRCAIVGVTYVVVLLLAHPRIWMEFDIVVIELLGQLGAYESGLLGHAIEPGLAHAWKMAIFLAHALSPFLVGSILLSALALFGLFETRRLPREQAFVLLFVPVFYFAYFSTVNSMIVRNLMLLMPFLAVFVGIGAGRVFELLPGRRARWSAGALLVAALLANAVHLYWAAETVRRYDERTAVGELVRVIESRPDERFAITRSFHTKLRRYESTPETRNWRIITRETQLDEDETVALSSHEFRVLAFSWPANEIGRYRDFGPKDVDWDYYPGWGAVDRPVMMSRDVYLDLRVIRRRPKRDREGPAEAEPS